MATKAATPSHMLHSGHSRLRPSPRHLKDERYAKSRTSFEVEDTEYDEVINLSTWETMDTIRPNNNSADAAVKLPAIARVVHAEEQAASPRLPMLNTLVSGGKKKKGKTPPSGENRRTPRSAPDPQKPLLRREAMLEQSDLASSRYSYSDTDGDDEDEEDEEDEEGDSSAGDNESHGQTEQYSNSMCEYNDDFEEDFTECETHTTAKNIFYRLAIPDEYLNAEFDGCYCPGCSTNEMCSTSRRIIDEYGIPNGWCKFGLRPPPLVLEMNHIFTEWPVAFYVIKSKNLINYLETGDLFVGMKHSRTPRQQKRGEDTFWVDHLTGQTSTHHSSPEIKLSPIIDTAEKLPSSPLAEFVTLEDDIRREVKFALQVRVRPKSYEERGATTKHIQSRRGPVWKVRDMGAVMLEAILIRVGNTENTAHSHLPNLH